MTRWPLSALLFAQRRHEAPGRSRKCSVVMNIEDGSARLSFARKRQLLPAAFIRTVLDIAHEREIRFAAGLQLENDGSIRIGVCSPWSGVASGSQQHCYARYQAHRIT